MRKNKITALALTIAMLLAVLSGCVLAETGFEFAEDGSVKVSDGLYYSEDYFKEIGQTPQEFFAGLDEPVLDVSTAAVDGKTYYGFTRYTDFASVDELKQYHDSSEDELPWSVETLTEDGRSVLRMSYHVDPDTEALAALADENGEIPDVEGLILARLRLSFPGGVKSVSGAALGSYRTEGREMLLTLNSGESALDITVEGYLDGAESFVPAVNVLPFTDVDILDHFYDAVVWAFTAEPQVTDGTSATTFSPERTCTRGQVVTFLWRAAGCPEPESAENPFADVAEGDYFYKPVLWAVEKGITDGMRPTEFMPALNCTNAHILTFIYRAAGEPEKSGEGAWWQDALDWAEKNDMLAGTFQGEYGVTDDCPRANVITYLYRYASGSGAEE